MPENNVVSFDKATSDRFRMAYHHAVAADKEQFTFEGNRFDVGYAQYLVQYLADKLGGKYAR